MQNGLVNEGPVPSVMDPLKSHFLRESSSFKYRRKKRVSFGTIAIEDRRPPRSSISSVVLRGKGTVLRYIELEKVTASKNDIIIISLHFHELILFETG